MDTQTKLPPPYDGPQDVQVITSAPAATIHYSPKDPPYTGGIPPRPPMGKPAYSTTCKNCQRPMVTELLYRSSTKTHLCAFGLCLIGFWPCVCIPYCTNTCKHIDHYCPYCGAYVGTYAA